MSVNYNEIRKNFILDIVENFKVNLDELSISPEGVNLEFYYNSCKDNLEKDLEILREFEFTAVIDTSNINRVILAEFQNSYYLITNSCKLWENDYLIAKEEKKWAIFLLTFRDREYYFKPNLNISKEIILDKFVPNITKVECYYNHFFKDNIYELKVLKLKNDIIKKVELDGNKEDKQNELFRILSLLELKNLQNNYFFNENLTELYEKILSLDSKFIKYEKIYYALIFRISKNKKEEYLSLYKLIENLYAVSYVHSFKDKLSIKDKTINEIYKFISKEMSWKHTEIKALKKLIKSVNIDFIKAKYSEFHYDEDDNNPEKKEVLSNKIYSLRNHIVHLSYLVEDTVNVDSELENEKYFDILLLLLIELYEKYKS